MFQNWLHKKRWRKKSKKQHLESNLFLPCLEKNIWTQFLHSPSPYVSSRRKGFPSPHSVLNLNLFLSITLPMHFIFRVLFCFVFFCFNVSDQISIYIKPQNLLSTEQESLQKFFPCFGQSKMSRKQRRERKMGYCWKMIKLWQKRNQKKILLSFSLSVVNRIFFLPLSYFPTFFWAKRRKLLEQIKKAFDQGSSMYVFYFISFFFSFNFFPPFEKKPIPKSPTNRNEKI